MNPYKSTDCPPEDAPAKECDAFPFHVVIGFAVLTSVAAIVLLLSGVQANIAADSPVNRSVSVYDVLNHRPILGAAGGFALCSVLAIGSLFLHSKRHCIAALIALAASATVAVGVLRWLSA